MRGLSIALMALLAGPALADDTTEGAFLDANILGIFYHELGHAVIATEGVPIFGQEEDAADVFSIFLIDALFEDEDAEALAYEAVLGFAAEAAAREREEGEIAWWDVHGPDEQRLFNTACIFYGADPDSRQDFATDLGLPEYRADSCPEEYDQAAASWGQILDEMTETGDRPEMSFEAEDDSRAIKLIRDEVTALNKVLRLSRPVTVSVESCDEANAWFDPEADRIVFCSEFETHLREINGLL